MRTTRFWAACADTIPEGCDHRTFHGGPDGLKLAKEASVRSFRGFWEGQLSTNRYWDTHVVEWIEERQAPGKSGVLPVYRMYSLRYNRPIDDFIYHEQIRKEPRISKLAPTEYYVETLEMEE